MLHLGNYLGAVRPWLQIQQQIADRRQQGSGEQNPLLISVVDLHAITIPQPPASLSSASLSLASLLLACGLSPAHCSLFLQSHVPQHAELSWLLSCCTPHSWLNHMTQYKEKSRAVTAAALPASSAAAAASPFADSFVSLGLYSYPLLMASDILLYKTTVVPVGSDQAQHLELTRSIAQRFNAAYAPPESPVFPSPQTLTSSTPRLMSLRDPGKKMSKSDPSPLSRIELTDSADAIAHKVRKAVTDSLPGLQEAEGQSRDGVRNLLRLLCECSGRSEQAVLTDSRYAGAGKQQLKDDVADAVIALVSPVRAEWERVSKDEAWLRRVLRDGAEQAREKAEQTLAEVKQLMGLVNR